MRPEALVQPGLRARGERALLAIAVAAFLAGGALGVYRYVDGYWLYRGFPPPRDPAYVSQPGTTETIAVASPALGGRRQQVVVYLPPGYDNHPARRYPVVYLLHGFPGRPLAFLETVRMGVVLDSLVAKSVTKGAILVMPFGSTGTFTDKEWANGVHANEGWETFVARDVVGAVDARYRTIRSGAARAIAGLSEGGYGAVNIAFHHPGEFRVVESWSGYMRADDVLSIFGRQSAQLAYNSPTLFLPQVARALRGDRTYVWFYTGGKDSFLAQNRAFASALARSRIPHRFALVPGGHSWVAWRDEARPTLLVALERLTHA